jgi:CMP-N-acetylneuraminic acid synthetase
MKIIAIIPARAGSTSIKNKNLIKIKNKPLISFSIAAAKKSKLINRVIVTTDSKNIKKVAIKNGAEVPFLRPKKISGFLSRDIEYLKHCIKLLKKEKYTPDLIILLRPTTPFREIKIIDEAIQLMIKNKADSLRSVSVAKETPFKMWRKKGKLITPIFGMKNINKTNYPRQKLEKFYWQNGYIDIIKPETIKKYGNELGKKIIFYEIKTNIFEIDYKYQLKFANKFYQNYKIVERNLYPS